MGEFREWVFTFGYGQPNAGKYVRISGTYNEAREEMFRRYGSVWAFQYPAEKWDEWEKDPEQGPYMEKEMKE